MRPDLNILSDESRCLILALIFQEDELCVCELTEALREIQPKVSRQLAILKKAGWIVSRREGTWIHYRLVPLPQWAVKLVSALVEGGVPAATQKKALTRIRSFPSRPNRPS